MSYFSTRLVAIFFLALRPLDSGACEALLKSSQYQLTLAKAAFAKEADTAPFSRKDLESIFSSSLTFPVHENKRFWLIVFDPKYDSRGYKVSGHKEGGQFIIEYVRRSENSEEREYFQSVATIHNLKAETVNLRKKILACGTVTAAPAVTAKLWLKHRLNLEAVRYTLDGVHTIPTHETPKGKSEDDERYSLRGASRSGRTMFVVIAKGAEACPLRLVTAYEED